MSKISKRKESSSADNESELLECFEPKVKLIVAAFLCQSHPKRIKIDGYMIIPVVHFLLVDRKLDFWFITALYFIEDGHPCL